MLDNTPEPVDEGPRYVKITKKQSQDVTEIAETLRKSQINFKGNQNKGLGFTEKIKNISKMIDYMARERSKTRRSKRRQARSVHA